jgi:ketosteroid isomerase-like protein
MAIQGARHPYESGRIVAVKSKPGVSAKPLNLSSAVLVWAATALRSFKENDERPVDRKMNPETVLRLHTDFNRALLRQDHAALSDIYSERYMLVRPDGSVLNKEQVLKDLRNGGLTFHSVDLESPVVRVLGSAAILTANSATDSSRHGKRTVANIRLVAVYADEGDGVRLVHFQSVLLPHDAA